MTFVCGHDCVCLAQKGRFMLLFCFAEASAAKFRHAILFLHLFGDQPRRSILDRKNSRKAVCLSLLKLNISLYVYVRT